MTALRSPFALAGIVVLVVLVLLIGTVVLAQRSLVFLPDTGTPAPAGRLVEGASDTAFRTGDGLELGAMLVPARPAADTGMAVLVAPGNGGNRADRAGTARALSDAGFTVLAFDYRGYGGNPDSPSEDGLAEDARSARRHLLEETGLRPDRLLYFGESLGTAVVTRLAAEQPPAGLLLRSPFPSLADLARVHYPYVPGALLRDRFALAEHLAEVRAPVTVVYGDADTIVPPRLSERVAAVDGPDIERVVISGAGHNDPVMFTGDEVVGSLRALAERAR
ncbi:hypothetical protein CLV63_12933 [Murinocardiopsis flavida]|uniref:AB hydrolase-1 domain-containing protein n=1 Tax=Murinocardiopsis flavida TaxID=645275 RepID=A0A2P8CUW0_9ACTN|nr:alpha/beta fold hydrolase [Murinocardiopsis flavida]PSK88747.1 hypothetical protein CLV63_12933 [Murinocardiopsis flavida]